MNRSNGWRRGFIPTVVIAGLWVLTAVMVWSTLQNDDKPLTTLDPRGAEATDVHNLVRPVFIVAGIVFVLVQGGVCYLILKFRRRDDGEPDDLADEPSQVHGHFWAELGWTIGPAVLLAALAIPNVSTVFALEERDADALAVEVIGQQWWWEFRYDVQGDGGAVGADGRPDIITATEMVIPVGRQVDLTIRSNDVIHSFWIPALNGKRDAVPGRSHTLSFTADEPGIYEGQCTEYCGLSHALMQMRVIALDQDDYEAWIDNQLAPPVAPSTEQEERGRDAFVTQCSRCHQINGVQAQIDGSNDPADFVPQEAYAPLAVDGTESQVALEAQNAPNLTHFASRETFAGSILRLYTEGHDPYFDDDAASHIYVNELEEWIRNPNDVKPMAADDLRGMPDLGLAEAQIDDLVAYLISLE